MATYYSCNLYDNSTSTVIATGYGSTLQAGMALFITDVTTNTDYTATVNFATGSTVNNLLMFSLSLTSEDCDIVDLSFWAFTSDNSTPAVIITDFGKKRLGIIDPGNCSTRVCFDEYELEELYQKALNMCKICNCT